MTLVRVTLTVPERTQSIYQSRERALAAAVRAESLEGNGLERDLEAAFEHTHFSGVSVTDGSKVYFSDECDLPANLAPGEIVDVMYIDRGIEIKEPGYLAVLSVRRRY